VTGVPFGDFAAHVRSLRPQIDEALARVLASGRFVLGPEVDALEQELAAAFEAAACVTVANGTEAIQLALEAIGIGPGDEVVTSPLTAAFTALAIARAGARPVFADVEEETLNVSPAAALRAITARTRAILPVHLYGHPADLDPLVELARPRRIAVVEDACQAHFARYKGRRVGALTGMGALSFYPTKNLGAFGDGGAVLVQERGVAERLRLLRNGGQRDRYRHELVGTNSRLDEMQAALLRAKLPFLERWTRRRRDLAALYARALEGSGVRVPREQPYAEAVHHLFVIRHAARDALAMGLRRRGIETLVHYPIPLHLQPAFAWLGGRAGDFPVAERAAGEILSLPLYPEMTDGQAEAVAAAVRELVCSTLTPR
jgi:dTDP-3-amino-3,4,6-trideoxy-alpha-D-glucose transaminase